MARRRVVLTGLGTVNPLAHCVEDFWSALLAGQSGIRTVQGFPVEIYACHIAGEVQDWQGVPDDIVPSRENRRMDPFAQFALAAAAEAVRDSGIDFSHEDPNRCGAVVGSGIGGLQELETQHKKMLTKGADRASPFTVPKLMSNAAASNIAILWGLKGPNFSVTTACASAANAIGEACEIIRRGRSDVMVVGGSEAAVTPIGMSSFCALKGLSTRNDDPAHASRPFDKGRDGFLLSEGAGIGVIEELEHARSRGANIYAELVGYASTCDAYHITAPDPEGNGASTAMSISIADAGLGVEDIDYINTHGTSTVLGDIAETRAVKRVFGDHARGHLMLSSTKSSTGHLLGASGGVEMIATCLAITRGVIPPTWNLDEPDEECDLDYVPNEPREAKIDIAMSNSFGFGGHNACLVFKRFDG